MFKFEETEIPVTISIGVALYTPDIGEVNDFIKVADDKLYEAKMAGRNRVVS